MPSGKGFPAKSDRSWLSNKGTKKNIKAKNFVISLLNHAAVITNLKRFRKGVVFEPFCCGPQESTSDFAGIMAVWLILSGHIRMAIKVGAY